jgi:DNA mismatch repair protein MutS
LPAAAVSRAEEVLKALEGGAEAQNLAKLADDLPLFSARPKGGAPRHAGNPELEAAIDAVLPDELTPKQALEALYELKRLRAKGTS